MIETMIVGGAMGFILQRIGYGPDTWQFWALLTLALYRSLIK